MNKLDELDLVEVLHYLYIRIIHLENIVDIESTHPFGLSKAAKDRQNKYISEVLSEIKVGE